MNQTTRIRISSYEISFNSITATLFHSFVRKNVFYSKNIQYAYNLYGTDLNVCRGVFRTKSNIYDEAFLQKSQKSFIVDARLVSRSQFLSDIAKVNLKICHCVLASPINKTHFALTKKCDLFSGFLLLLTS